jgi:hypothetical protein
VATAHAATPIQACVPAKAQAAFVTPNHGKCAKGYKLTTLGQQGPEGKRGKAGDPGGEGRPGPEGPQGPEGADSFNAEQREKLKLLLPHMTFIASGVGGDPTIQFSGVNVQVVSGAGKTQVVNGEGNLVIGYDENEGHHAQTGSNNLVLGGEQTFTSYAGIVAGFDDSITAPFAAIAGGARNTVEGGYSTILGGTERTELGEYEAEL